MISIDMMMDLFGLAGPSDDDDDDDEMSMYDRNLHYLRPRNDELIRRPLSTQQDNTRGPVPFFTLFASLGKEKHKNKLNINQEKPGSSRSNMLAGLGSPGKLLDMSSMLVAKTCTCEQLENCQPPLDEALLKKVAYWAFPQDVAQVQAYSNIADKYNSWERGVNLYRDSGIKEMWQVGFMATAYLNKRTNNLTAGRESTGEIRVSLTFEQQKVISSSCSECQADVCWCTHVIAAVLYRIHQPEKVRVHAPMTETLSTLDRDQLQKLVQYAVQEDPAGILGKVFKHIDDIRDSTSDINMMAGAPDPTFGGVHGSKTQWQLSMENLEKNLLSDLQEMTRERSYNFYNNSNFYYPDNLNWKEKVESKMFKYVKKALNFVQLQQVGAALSIFQLIAKCTMSQMMTISQVHCPALSRFHHDLVHFFAMFVLHPKGNKEKVLSHVKELQSSSKVMRLVSHKLKFSRWAELPNLMPLYEDKLTQEDKQGLYSEVVCASMVDSQPEGLSRLLGGSTVTEESTCNEDVRVLLARLEAILFLDEPTEDIGDIARMSAFISRKLTVSALRHSVLGVYLQMIGFNSTEVQSLQILLGQVSQLSVFREKSPLKNSEIPQLILKGKGKGKRTKSSRTASKIRTSGRVAAAKPSGRVPTAKSSGRVSAAKSSGRVSAIKKQKLSHPTDVHTSVVAPECSCHDLTIGELVYSMLYLCKNMIACWSQGRLEDQGYLAGFCLLTLELSRYRTITDSIQDSEQAWLAKLETSLHDFLSSGPEFISQAVILYIKALRSVGSIFYGGGYPLALLDLLLYLALRNEQVKTEYQEDVLHICADFLLDSGKPLQAFTNSSSDMHVGNGHRNFALRKFHTVSETFFSLLDTEKDEHVALGVMVLEQIGQLDSAILHAMTNDLRLHLAKLQVRPELLEGALQVLLQSLKSYSCPAGSDKADHRSQDFDLFLTLVSKLGVRCLHLVEKAQSHGFLSCSDVKRLLQVLSGEIRAERSVPREVVALVMGYFSALEQHDDTACDLLDLFKRNDANYRKAVRAMCNNAVHFSVAALFQLAQKEARQDGANPVAATGKKSMTVEVFAIVRKAVEGLEMMAPSEVSPETYSYLDWAYELCSGTAFFTRLVDLLTRYAMQHPSILLRALEFAERTPSLAEQALPLGGALVTAYRDHFTERIAQCGHAAYRNVIGEMRKARLHCKLYQKGGDKQFDKLVLSHIQKYHSGKKKLLHFLEQEFGNASMKSSNPN